CVVFACILLFSPQPLRAEFVIDSNDIGADDVIPDPMTWTSETSAHIGDIDNGDLLVYGNEQIQTSHAYIGYTTNSTGTVTIEGPDATWINSGYFYVGRYGDATLNIINGAKVHTASAFVSYAYASGSAATVSGPGSTWITTNRLTVGQSGTGTLTITNGGLVRVGELLTIDAGYWSSASTTMALAINTYGSDNYVNDSSDGFINMANGGMLALYGGDPDFTLTDFLNLIEGDGIIQYWDTNIANWANITDATDGDDYTLVHHTDGDLAGYTVLTVGIVPEPSTVILMLTTLTGWFFVRRR
ncbi:MAG: PEP-CTERM sorting domain-containing protein, partial [Planctomycetia bacterium]